MKQLPTFSSWLKSVRGDTSLRVYAGCAGIDHGTLSRAERGETEVTLETAVRVCLALKRTLADLYREWLGRPAPVFAQVGQEQSGQDALTRQDISQWVLWIIEGRGQARELLVAALNLVVSQAPLLEEANVYADPLFTLADIGKLLCVPWVHLEMPPSLPQVSALLPTVVACGGLILPAEIGAHIRLLRRERKLSLAQVAARSGLRVSTLESLEDSSAKRVLLEHIIRLDDSLEQHGNLLSLYWWEIESRFQLDMAWRMGPCSLQAKQELASLLINVGRRLQTHCTDNTIWLRMIRTELQAIIDQASQ